MLVEFQLFGVRSGKYGSGPSPGVNEVRQEGRVSPPIGSERVCSEGTRMHAWAGAGISACLPFSISFSHHR